MGTHTLVRGVPSELRGALRPRWRAAASGGEFEEGVSSFASLYETARVLPVEVTTIEIIEAVVPADYTAECI